MEPLRELEIFAYSTVLKAFMAGPVDEWDREEVMTKLRALWNIDNDVHMDVIKQLKADPELQAIREGRPGVRINRSKSFKPGGSQPFPTLATQPSLQGPLSADRAAAALGPSPFEDQPQQGAEPASPREAPSQLTADSRPRRGVPGSANRVKGGGARPQKQRQQQGGGGGKGGKKQPGALGSAPSLQRRGPGRPLGTPGGLVRSASTRQQRPSRPRSSSLTGVTDPRGFLGKRCWRLWPNESPPWVEGVVYEYEPESDSYTILYDPNTDPESGHAETMEGQYMFSNPDEYVLCEKIDFLTMPGSRRQWEKPTPESPPPPMPMPLITGAPSKKRKSLAPAMPVPQVAPFDPGYLASRLQLAGEEELVEMAGVLERREQAIEAELVTLTGAGASEEELARRAELERRLLELGDKEWELMQELAKLRDVEL